MHELPRRAHESIATYGGICRVRAVCHVRYRPARITARCLTIFWPALSIAPIKHTHRNLFNVIVNKYWPEMRVHRLAAQPAHHLAETIAALPGQPAHPRCFPEPLSRRALPSSRRPPQRQRQDDLATLAACQTEFATHAGTLRTLQDVTVAHPFLSAKKTR